MPAVPPASKGGVMSRKSALERATGWGLGDAWREPGRTRGDDAAVVIGEYKGERETVERCIQQKLARPVGKFPEVAKKSGKMHGSPVDTTICGGPLWGRPYKHAIGPAAPTV